MKKYYEITVDTIYSNKYYVLSESQDKAEKYAKKQAHENHHGESILGVKIHDTSEIEKPKYLDDYDDIN